MTEITYIITENNIQIKNSYVISKTKFDYELNRLRQIYSTRVLTNRTNRSLKREWAVHNLLYNLHFFRSHTKDVDLNYPQKWYIRFAYTVFGSIALLLIP